MRFDRMLQRTFVSILVTTTCGLGCGGPAAPDLPDLSIGPDDLVIDRGTDVQLTATIDTSAGTDVTALVVWSSSDSLIASVVGGRVTGHRPGQVTISASYGGSSDSTIVTIRRRIGLWGQIDVANRTGGYSIALVIARLDGDDIGYFAAEESGRADAEVRIGGSSIFDSSVSPGEHELSLYISHRGPRLEYDVTPSIKIIDLDSSLVVGNLDVAVRRVAIGAPGGEVTWAISVPPFP